MKRSFFGAVFAVVALFAVAAPALAQDGNRLPASPEARPAQPGMLAPTMMGCPQGGCTGCVQQSMHMGCNTCGVTQCGYSQGGCCDSCNSCHTSSCNTCNTCNNSCGRSRRSSCCNTCDSCCNDCGRSRRTRRCCR